MFSEMGEALEIAENRCNTLKEQLDQMRHIYRERSNAEQSYVKRSAGMDSRTTEVKPTPKPILRQNSEAITTDNSGAAVLTINNILNGITNSINRLSELHTYIEPENPPYTARKKSKQAKTQENEFVSENRNPKCSSSRSSSWIFNEKKSDHKKRTKRVKTDYSSGSLTQIKKLGVRAKIPSAREEAASTTSVRNRKKNKRLGKTLKKIPSKRPGFNSNVSSNHLVEIYHNSALDYADSEELIHTEQARGQRSHVRSTHADLRNKYSRKEVQMPTISTTDCKEDDEAHGAVRPEGYRSLSPIKEQEPNMEVIQQQEIQYRAPFFFGRSYQSPTISSKMKQVARGYFRHFTCKSIPFCAAKSTSPSHNIGINIQQVMSIIKGRQSTQGISPTLAHNIGLAAERLNNNSFTALLSTFGSRHQYGQMPCPMQCNVNYQQLQEMATDMPNDENLDDDAQNECEQNKIEIEIANRKSQENLCWSIDPNNHNNCTCVNGAGVGFHQIVDKYQNYAPAPGMVPNSGFSLQQSVYSQKIQKQASKKYRHIRSAYAQYNDSRKMKRDSISELSTMGGDSSLPMQGKEKILKGVLLNLHEEFSSLSDKFDELSKIIEDEKHSNPDNIEKLEMVEKKLNEKELEIQMVMTLYTEVVNLKAQLKALKEKLGMSAAVFNTQKHRMKMYQRYEQQEPTQFQQEQPHDNNGNPGCQQYFNSKVRENTRTSAALHLTKLLRQIQAYREVCKTGGK